MIQISFVRTRIKDKKIIFFSLSIFFYPRYQLFSKNERVSWKTIFAIFKQHIFEMTYSKHCSNFDTRAQTRITLFEDRDGMLVPDALFADHYVAIDQI